MQYEVFRIVGGYRERLIRTPGYKAARVRAKPRMNPRTEKPLSCLKSLWRRNHYLACRNEIESHHTQGGIHFILKPLSLSHSTLYEVLPPLQKAYTYFTFLCPLALLSRRARRCLHRFYSQGFTSRQFAVQGDPFDNHWHILRSQCSRPPHNRPICRQLRPLRLPVLPYGADRTLGPPSISTQ